MMEAVIDSTVYSWERNAHATVIQNSTNTHHNHIRYERVAMDMIDERWRIQYAVVSESFQWVDVHVIPRLWTFIIMMYFMKCSVEKLVMHQTVPIIF
jgi:hypothetical protein